MSHDQSNEHQGESHGEGAAFVPTRPSRRALYTGASLVAVVLATALALGTLPRVQHAKAMAQAEAAPPKVQVAVATKDAASAALSLPASIHPLQETTVFARANGYVRKWYPDIGAQVKKGDVLVELDLPDVDEELSQATAAANQSVASIAQVKSQLELASTTNKRFTALVAGGIVTQQAMDEVASQLEVQRANLTAAEAARANAEANVRRVRELRAYGKIVAPFDGVVTMRAAETGQLVVAGTGQGQALYKIAEDDVVRAFVDVPQLFAQDVVVGVDAAVTVREARGRVFMGKVTRTSRSLDTASRALHVEVDVPNADRALVSGSYAKVQLTVKRQGTPVTVPATSVLVDASGARVAVVRDGAVHWQKVEIESDLGDRVTLASGLSEGETVALLPSARLLEGVRVTQETAPPPAQTPPKGR